MGLSGLRQLMNARSALPAALERLGGDLALADDECPSFALVLGFHADAPPDLWFALSDDPVAHPATRLRFGGDAGAGSGRPAPFTIADLRELHQWLGDFLRQYTFMRDGRHPVDVANEDHERRRAAAFDRLLAAGLHEIEHPFQCDGCGRRYKTQGPLTRHKSTCTHGKGGHTNVGWTTAQSGRCGIQCRCGFYAWGDTRSDAQREMRAHIDAAG